jgi:hypothetical protein
MIFEKLVSRNVPSIYAGDRVVHEELGIEFRNAGAGRYGPEGLAKIIPPLGERISIFLCF